MKLVDIPTKFNIPFANNAGVGFITPVPQIPSGVTGRASLQLGFPPENFQPAGAGGVPPFGQDFNGITNQMTAWARWQAAGGAFPPYDPTFQTAIGGYPQNACVASRVEVGLIWMTFVDDNITDPDAGGAGWYVFNHRLTTNTDLYVNGTTGNDNNNGLTPTSAFATLQKAYNTVLLYNLNGYTVTIHAAAGTYAPAQGGVVNGSGVISLVGPGSSCIISAASGPALIFGGNRYTVTGVKLLSAANGVSTPGAGVLCISGVAEVLSVEFGFCADSHIATDLAGSIAVRGPIIISGGGNAHMSARGNSIIYSVPPSLPALTISTAVSFVTAFVYATNSNISTTYTSITGAGNVTGPRYFAWQNGVISSNGGGANYYPGTVAGSVSSGGQYV